MLFVFFLSLSEYRNISEFFRIPSSKKTYITVNKNMLFHLLL